MSLITLQLLSGEKCVAVLHIQENYGNVFCQLVPFLKIIKTKKVEIFLLYLFNCNSHEDKNLATSCVQVRITCVWKPLIGKL